MVMETLGGKASVSKALARLVTIKITRSCGDPTDTKRDAHSVVFAKGEILELPLYKARELVGRHQAHYVEEQVTVDAEELAKREAEAVKKRKAAVKKAG